MQELVYTEETKRLQDLIADVMCEQAEASEKFSSDDIVEIQLNVLVNLLSKMCATCIIHGQPKGEFLDSIKEEITKRTETWVKVIRENIEVE